MFFNLNTIPEPNASGKKNRFDKTDLAKMQGYSLSEKKWKVMDLIADLDNFTYGKWYVSFSGGKDSEVAVDMAARFIQKRNDMINTMKGLTDTTPQELTVVHVMTGLEYQSVHQFVPYFCDFVSQKYGVKINLKTLYPNPNKNFVNTLTKEGYPLISKEVSQCIYEARKGLEKGDGSYQYRLEKLNGTHKDKDGKLSPYNMQAYKPLLYIPVRISHKCCYNTKKEPAYEFEKTTGMVPLLATTAEESRLRKTNWFIHGCNAFSGEGRHVSAPFSIWLDNDFLTYIHDEGLPIAEAYGEILPQNTTGFHGQLSLFDSTGYQGCRYCTTGCDRTGCMYCMFGITQDINRFLRAQEMEPHRMKYVLQGGTFDSEGYLVPTQKGLGFAFILDWLKFQMNLSIPYIPVDTEREYFEENGYSKLYGEWLSHGAYSPMDKYRDNSIN